MQITLLPTLVCALAVRVALLLYGEWQDRTMIVKYTDVDYYVFTDAARYVTQGQSPYNRTTYRYTPLLAWLLVPNILCTALFGKILFILLDILAGYIIYKILTESGVSKNSAVWYSTVWLFNPLPMTVSSRGNAESVMSVLVLGTLYFLDKKCIVTAAMFYGLSVHVKIYPVTYALPIYLYLKDEKERQVSGSPLQKILKWLWPNRTRLLFIAVAGAVFIGLSSICYISYGTKFLEETYFYHVTRRDIRHNFSVYFYMLYLMDGSAYSFYIGLLVFLPQVALLVVFSFKYSSDLHFCCFLHTFVFVTLNKVITSQYFLWYLTLLPLILPKLKFTSPIQDGGFLLASWMTGQALWLLPAYYLEFEGKNTFLLLWMAGLVFLLLNTIILDRVLQAFGKYRQELSKMK